MDIIDNLDIYAYAGPSHLTEGEGPMSEKKNSQSDYYAVLGVSYEATPEQIKTAYRDWVKANRPDIAAASDDITLSFSSIQHAYSVLSDSVKRAAYDRSLRPVLTLTDVFTSTEFGRRLLQLALPAASASAQPGGDIVLEADIKIVEGFAEGTFPERSGQSQVDLHLDASVLRQYGWVRLPAQGGHGLNGGEAGDAWIRLRVGEVDHG